MYCRNCGEHMNDNQAICLKCGVKVGEGNQYCPNCGKEVNEKAEVCLNCGVSIKKTEAKEGGDLNGHDKIKIALFSFFLGNWGVHNFIMGEKKKGFTKIALFLCCGISIILNIIDLIKILTNSYTYNPDAMF